MERVWRNDVTASEAVERRIDMWRALGGLLMCALFAVDAWHWHATFLPFWLMNMAVHESGHAIFRTLTHNELVMLIMGNGFEALFPLVIGIWFLVRRRNWVAFAICMAWVADTLVGAAIYIADAPVGALPLIGVGSRADAGTPQLGDWARVLGPEHLDKLFLAGPIARDVTHVAVAFTLLGFGALAFGTIRNQQKLRRLQRGPKPKLDPVPLAPVTPEQMWR
jgi:hypothetical protein